MRKTFTNKIGYKIADLQIKGRYFADGEIFDSKEDIRQQLISYHEVDMCEEDLPILKKMSLEDILDFGDWEIETIHLTHK